VRLLGLTETPEPGTPADEIFCDWRQSGTDALTAIYDADVAVLESPASVFLSVERSSMRGRANSPSRDIFMLRDTTAQMTAEMALNDAYGDLQSRMSEIQELQQELQEQATRDPLTGLHNRRFLVDEMERGLVRAAREPYPVSVVMIGVDRFKEANDTYGHAAGDAVLRAIAEQLRSRTRRCDIICRYGGDEFVVVLPHTTTENAVVRAERWRLALRDALQSVGPGMPSVTMSPGVATFPETGTSTDALIAAGDRAVYAAKSGGRDRVCVA
jgi:diguanylate cyclase (GGDEF)-like protein